MTKIDVVSGFLGAGKTTLIKKLLKEALIEKKVVLIENEFGEIGIDGGFLKEAGIEIKEMNSGCICCSLVGDFGASLKEVLTTYSPERVLIEPSGVGKLSDVLKAVEDVAMDLDVKISSAVVVVDAMKCKMYMKNFGEFFINQVEYAGTIILSRTEKLSQDKLNACVDMLREHNKKAAIITTPWDSLEGKDILGTMEGAAGLENLMQDMLDSVRDEHSDHSCCREHEQHHGHHDEHEHGHHHGHHDEQDHDHHDGQDHEHHHDHHDEYDREHHHDHHDKQGNDHHHEDAHGHQPHDENCTCGCHDHDHEHHHDKQDYDHHHEDAHGHQPHDENCTCGCHDHGHDYDHHHAEEVFTSWGMETPNVYGRDEVARIMSALDSGEYGMILRAKGMVPSADGTWIYYDYVPQEHDIRSGKPDVTGKICVIGTQLKEEKLAELFRR